MSFLEKVKSAWHDVRDVSSENLVKQKVRWCATDGDKVRHAHLGGFRVCEPRLLVSDPVFWVKRHSQPRGYCSTCRGKLRAENLGKARLTAAKDVPT